MLTYDFPAHYKGDFWEGVSSITLTRDTSAVNLSGATVCMQIKPRAHAEPAITLSTANGGITITSAVSGEIRIPGRVIDLAAATYVYDLQYKIPSINADYVQTALTGKFTVTQDVTIC